MAELNDEAYTSNKPTALPAHSLNASQKKSYSRRNRNIRNQGGGFYSNGQGRNLEICLYCHVFGHNKSNCWKKYLEKLPNA